MKDTMNREIVDEDFYNMNSELYEGLVVRFTIQYKSCAACIHVKKKCKNCENGSKFEQAKVSRVSIKHT